MKVKHTCNSCENKFVVLYESENETPEFCPFCTEPLDLELNPLDLD